jgi:hypothetical protein
MMGVLEELLRALRPAFTRQATFAWFVVAFAGVVTRQDVYGVSSIIRALSLAPVYYPALLHFFHSTAWTAEQLYRQWEGWLIGQPVVERVEGRIVILGDHTKQPKDGRRMPQVTTMHQDSETSSKPSFFRGHHWGCLSLLGQTAGKRFALPLWAEIHPEDSPDKRTTRLVHVAAAIGLRLQEKMFLVLDAFFSVGPVFRAAAESNGRLHILTRAKKNIVAYRLPPPPRPPLFFCGRDRRRAVFQYLDCVLTDRSSDMPSEPRFILTFDRASIPFVLRAFKKKVDADGYVVEEDGQEVVTPRGEGILKGEFAGIRRGSDIFVRDDMASILDVLDAPICVGG